MQAIEWTKWHTLPRNNEWEEAEVSNLDLAVMGGSRSCQMHQRKGVSYWRLWRWSWGRPSSSCHCSNPYGWHTTKNQKVQTKNCHHQRDQIIPKVNRFAHPQGSIWKTHARNTSWFWALQSPGNSCESTARGSRGLSCRPISRYKPVCHSCKEGNNQTQRHTACQMHQRREGLSSMNICHIYLYGPVGQLKWLLLPGKFICLAQQPRIKTLKSWKMFW